MDDKQNAYYFKGVTLMEFVDIQVILLVIIGIIAIIKIRASASSAAKKTSNNDNGDSSKSYCIHRLTQACHSLNEFRLRFRRKKYRNPIDDKTSGYYNKNGYPHGINSIGDSNKAVNQNREEPIDYAIHCCGTAYELTVSLAVR